jgi:hypothetical protein
MPNTETLLWLNDLVGQELHVELVVMTPDHQRRIFASFTVDGILRLCSGGSYQVGEVLHLDTTDLDASIRRREDSGLLLTLSDGVVLALSAPSRPGWWKRRPGRR